MKSLKSVMVLGLMLLMAGGLAAQEVDTTTGAAADTTGVEAADTTAGEAADTTAGAMEREEIHAEMISPVHLFLAEGDSLHDAFDLSGSLEAYAKAIEADSTNTEAMWKLARAYVDVGEKATGDANIKEAYKEAEKWGRECVAADDEDSMCHTYLAIAVGRVALHEGGKTKVNLSKEVKEEALRAIELNPDNDTPYHVLARWHREVTNLAWYLKAAARIVYGGLPPASNEEAIENFKKAIELKPEWINHHLELGITYKQMGMKDEARKEFEQVLSLGINDADDAGHKETAKKMLEEL